MKSQRLLVIVLSLFCGTLGAQNLLENDLKNWTEGTGSSTGFNRAGNSNENSREYGQGPFQNNVLLWKASPDSNSNADGGWVSDPHPIDPTKDYRFAVWIKKTNSNSGSTYFGCSTWNSGEILSLSGTVNNNPYFFNGDLPQLNKWYLLVGFVHRNSYSSTTSIGGVYDPISGSKVRNLNDFKFKSDATHTRHRTFLYYDTNTSDRQFYFAPRMEEINGSEPSIDKLLGRAMTNKLVFVYDASGNQKIRRAPNNTSGTPTLKTQLPEELVESTEQIDPLENEDDYALFENSLVVFPNPTSGNLTMMWDAKYNFLIQDIIVSDMGNRRIPVYHDQGSHDVRVDLTAFSPGLYLVNFALKNGRSITKKIIKR